MPQLNWPVTVVLVSVILAVSVLGGLHVIAADWIERTLSAVLGFIAGAALGFRGVSGILGKRQ